MGTGLDLSYIWSIDGLEPEGQVIMALSQNGSELYGRAKYEPDAGSAWNGNVAGSADGEEIELFITSLQNDSLVLMRLTGRYSSINQSLFGDFVDIIEGRIMKRGNFTAISINPDLSYYAPAIIGVEEKMSPAVREHIVREKASGGETSPSNQTYQANGSQSNLTLQGNSSPIVGYYDVHLDMDSILTGICSPGPALS